MPGQHVTLVTGAHEGSCSLTSQRFLSGEGMPYGHIPPGLALLPGDEHP